jgi:hypothetical protein
MPPAWQSSTIGYDSAAVGSEMIESPLMARRSHASRLSDIVMDELAGEQTPWDLDKHLSGCLAGYQTVQSYGAAVYFALEALSGIAHDVAVRANAGKLDADQLDTDWIISSCGPSRATSSPPARYALPTK